MNPMNQEISNTLSGELFYPSLEFLYKFRVIICTTIGAGFLARARTDHAWSFNHFDYVIIDDCGSIPISMNLIPIAGNYRPLLMLILVFINSFKSVIIVIN